MPSIACAQRLRDVGPTEPVWVEGETLAEALASLRVDYPRLQHYVLDDQGRVRKHVAVFIDGTLCQREEALEHRLSDDAQVLFLQALSGG